MGVNHDQFSHLSRLRPGSSAFILHMVVIVAKIVSLVAFWAPNRPRFTWPVYACGACGGVVALRR